MVYLPRFSAEYLVICFSFAVLCVVSASSVSVQVLSAKLHPEIGPFSPMPEGRCPLCGFTPLMPPTSTRRDVVLAAALSSMKRVEYFLRTLRTTGTRARIILFLSANKTISEQWRRFYTACDIEPVFVNHPSPVLEGSPKLSRYYYYHQWLSRHIDEVDRVIHTDTFDVIFQSDPFLPEIRSDKLYFTIEPVTIAASRWTEGWIAQCYGSDFLRQHGRELVSCSGVTAGGGALFLKYLKLMLNNSAWIQCFGHSLDQAHHNYLLYTNEFANAGIDIEPLDCNSPYLTMHFCCKIGKCNLTSDVVFGNNTARAPVLIHQYNRWTNLTKRNKVLCPGSAFHMKFSKEEMAPLETLPPLDFVLPNETKQYP